MGLIDFNSPEFREELKKAIEESIENYKLKVLREVFLTKEEFKEEMDKWHQDIAKIWQEVQKQREESMKIWQELQKQRDESNRHWEETNRHQEKTRRHQEETNRHQEETRRHFKQIEVSLHSLEGKTGPELETLVLDLMKETLQLENIDWKKIHKEPLIDRDGKVFPKDYNTDIDVLLENGNVYLIEVKATADNRDVYDLLNKSRLFQYLKKRVPSELILVALRMNKMNYQYAVQNKIHLIIGEII